ncbi:MAG TPA: DinB family protein [Bacteroidia bacterium]|jgi:hypothetical protein|nr:DinB family protein [Bacteroidia bacterium]
MDTTTSLQEQVNTTLEQFISEFKTVADDIINAEPKQGTWTIGQLGQHIALGTAGVPDQKNEPANRPADKFETSIREVFLNEKEKYDSPKFLEPEKKRYQKEELLSKLESNKELLLKIIQEKKLDELCLDEAAPGWGHLTRYEWIKLIIYHTQRHIKQLKKLKASFGLAMQVN